ncbi:MAG: sulfatase-like hydrolase/transferase [Candidatus Sumerlaeia bacterium]
MRTIFILMDSLNRHFLPSYGGWVQAPNIQRLADKGIVFDKHYAGSLPCMPARREMMTGRINMLEAGWGAIEPYDDILPRELRSKRNVHCHLISDHYHYWEQAAHGYHTGFTTWEFVRGQEGDQWIPQVADPETPPFRGKNNPVARRQDWINRSHMDLEKDEDYPTPQCFMKGIEYLEQNHQEDNWHLHLEVFDPHEPFCCPKKYRDMYDDNWDGGYSYDWPQYAALSEEDDPETVEHVRKSYAGTLTMADTWLGKFLEKMDELDMWKDTTVILTTDHGHMLGEHGYWAKNYMFDYEELAHIPLIVYSPEAKMNGKRVSGLTATIDLMPTLMELHGAELPPNVHGKSIRHLFDADGSHNDAVMYGYFGKNINICDGKYTYTRLPGLRTGLFEFTAMPVRYFHEGGRQQLALSECGPFLDWNYGVPVFKIPVGSRRHRDAGDENLIYDLEQDPHQENPISDLELEARLEEKLVEIMERFDAPDCQYSRMNLRKTSP